LPLFASLHRALPKTHAGAAAIFIDEFDAGTPESSLDHCDRCWITDMTARFNIGSVSMEAKCFREVSHGPI